MDPQNTPRQTKPRKGTKRKYSEQASMSVTSSQTQTTGSHEQRLRTFLDGLKFGKPPNPHHQAAERRRSSLGISPHTLPSPSVVAARAYYLDSRSRSPNTSTGSQQPRRGSIIEYKQGQAQEHISLTGPSPRRHSMLPSLATQLESFQFNNRRGSVGASSRGEADTDLSALPQPPTSPVVANLKIEAEGNTSPGRNLNLTTDVPPRRRSEISCSTRQEILRQVPFQYTHEHLRDWGYAYLGNSSTADAFVNAVSLRRPSLALVQEHHSSSGFSDATNPTSNSGSTIKSENDCGVRGGQMTTIRARVIPRGRERNPFLIQRQFDIEELRKSIPKPVGVRRERAGSVPGGRSGRRESLRRRSIRQKERRVTGEMGRRGSGGRGGGIAGIPIHIEYALHFLPVLAALMLSGHVRKGDTIDLPVPNPESWREVVGWIYTGSGVSDREEDGDKSGSVLSRGGRELVGFLGGHG